MRQSFITENHYKNVPDSGFDEAASLVLPEQIGGRLSALKF
jgi:hypothetical protein